MEVANCGGIMNIDEKLVIDDFLDKSYLKKLQDIFLGINIPWKYSPDVVHENSDKETNFFYMTHTIFNVLDYTEMLYIDKVSYDVILPLLKQLNCNSLMRVKLNLYPNQGKVIEHKRHVDYPFSHQGAVFSLNTTDGYTILEDGTKVESVENRLFLFDASKPHSSTSPSNVKSKYS